MTSSGAASRTRLSPITQPGGRRMAGHYTLTEGAELDADEIHARSLEEFGEGQTRKFMAEFHKAACFAAENHALVPHRSKLAGETGLSLYPVNNYYLAYHPVADDHIVIVAVVHQARDLPNLLNDNAERIKYELSLAMEALTAGQTVPRPAAPTPAKVRI